MRTKMKYLLVSASLLFPVFGSEDPFSGVQASEFTPTTEQVVLPTAQKQPSVAQSAVAKTEPSVLLKTEKIRIFVEISVMLGECFAILDIGYTLLQRTPGIDTLISKKVLADMFSDSFKTFATPLIRVGEILTLGHLAYKGFFN